MAREKKKRAANCGERRLSSLDYRLPALWDCWGYAGRCERVNGQIIVEPRDYVTACLEWIEQNAQVEGVRAGLSLSQIQQRGRSTTRHATKLTKANVGKLAATTGGDWISQEIMYGMMVRATTAWDHDGDGRVNSKKYAELGTFLKSVLLLPLLKKMGITTVYLLPVVKISNLYRKGELGCPYSARNFLEFDASLHDPLFSNDPADVGREFAMFVECVHRLGMRIMLDIAPRTAARDCDWILEHPEWFYWIDRRSEKNWRSPLLPELTYGNPIPGRLGEIYDESAVQEYLAKFRWAPSKTHPQQWKRFVAEARRHPPKNLMAEIARRFGVVTPPGFSDVINDQQPPWSDVTYFRLYEDHPPEAAELLDEPGRQPPYVLFDTIKSNLFPGRKPIRALWNRIANILPFYQRFGIDGARVDMAHALPRELERMILDRPRRRDPDFCFFAEDLSHERTAAARKAGYNVVLGPSWYCQPRAHEGLMHKLVTDLSKLKAPILAAAETPDTPRAVVRKGAAVFSRQAVVVNMFLPNTVPMINSGMEIFERQPMNLGLDVADKPGRFALPKSDPFYGKLAFFDPVVLHWANRGGQEMVDLIAWAAAIRQQYLHTITRKSAWFAPKLTANAKHILATGFRLSSSREKAGSTKSSDNYKSLIMLANVDFDRSRRTTVVDLPGTTSKNTAASESDVLLELQSSPVPKWRNGRLTLFLPPGDVKIIRV